MTKLDTTEKKLKSAIVFSGFPNSAPHVSIILAAALSEPETLIKVVNNLPESQKKILFKSLDNYDKLTSWRSDSPYWKKKLEEVL